MPAAKPRGAAPRAARAPVAEGLTDPSDIDPSDIDTVTDAVLRASRLLVAVSARSIADVDDQITLPQFRLLVVLHSGGPLKLTALAEQLAVNPSTATRMVERLVNTGLITRQANPRSRRELVVALNEAGAGVVDAVTRRRRAEISDIIARVPPTTRQGLVTALTAFTEAGHEPPVTQQRDRWWSQP